MAKREKAEHIEQSLKMAITGKPLGYPFFREKRLNGERMLFLVYEQEVLLVLITDKKMQQRDIEYVLGRLDRFRSFMGMG